MTQKSMHVHTRAVLDVIDERQRQIAKGFGAEHDDNGERDDLARAAAWYATPAMMRNSIEIHGLSLWPVSWDTRWFKPSSRRRDLVKAAALIIAEIERIDREAVHA